MLIEVPKERIEQLWASIGKTNAAHNPYASILMEAEVFEKEGLEPVFYCDSAGIHRIVTSREMVNRKFS